MHIPFNGVGKSFKLLKSSGGSLCVREEGGPCLQRLIAGLHLLVRLHHFSGIARLYMWRERCRLVSLSSYIYRPFQKFGGTKANATSLSSLAWPRPQNFQRVRGRIDNLTRPYTLYIHVLNIYNLNVHVHVHVHAEVQKGNKRLPEGLEAECPEPPC